MPKRNYVSSARASAAAETRERIIAAGARLLRKDASIANFSLDVVAKAAGVTRLTVYNQFGSRRGLLEAVFDDIASRGGLFELTEVMAMADPRAALDRVVEIFCTFWGHDAAVGGLNQAIATDPEFGEALVARNERRRELLAALLSRIVGKHAAKRAVRDSVDLIFVLTSYPTFAALRSQRSTEEVCRLLQAACRAVVDALAFDGRAVGNK
ncbi:TetR/AcrR family transcriptional regulator [Bradyrhizobium zhanjiangense]|uniref:TetR/AcrR family transcriptional regulator n=1 Tax=Bradyrhizobium zhanjiangense TaxID=1325107 RepID=A0A4Q0QD40_9BRAD|nr:TetR/AcrR family transcriptional regulator [Bradyrhizobium zhanjiangense]RXG87817.1 TetR/AcrR family transcriptional regulator [Bradyrhizobium zhanjiangense]